MSKRSAIERAVDWLSEGSESSRRPGSGDDRQAPRLVSARRKRRPAPTRHSRKCSVCRHRDCEAIEQDFLSWRSPDQIATDYGIADHSSIYRHAHATGLFDRRARTIRLALSPIVERAMTVEVTADSIVRAVELMARLNGNGQLIAPTTHVIYDSNRRPAAPAESSQRAASQVQSRKSNRQNPQVVQRATC